MPPWRRPRSAAHAAPLLDDFGRPRVPLALRAMRAAFRVTNIALALLGLATAGYAGVALARFHRLPCPPGQRAKSPWFIYAFGGAGAAVAGTAGLGLVGVAFNSRRALAAYSAALGSLLLAQAGVALAACANKAWRRWLPADDTGEAEKIIHFIERDLVVVQWMGLVVLLMQILNILVANALSAAQRAALDAASDAAEGDAWGARGAAHASPPRPPPLVRPRSAAPPPGGEAWLARMRDVYGLDAGALAYDPLARDGGEVGAGGAGAEPPPPSGRACVVM